MLLVLASLMTVELIELTRSHQEICTVWLHLLIITIHPISR